MMGTSRTAGLVLALWLLAPCAAIAQLPRDRPTMPQAPGPTGTGVIAGRMTVTSPNGPQPVRRATVTLESGVFRTPLVTDTDTDGRFRFDKLPAAMYRLRGEKAGFVAVVADPRRVFEPAPEFEVKVGQTVTRDLPMQPGAALEGRVLKDNGEPAARIFVSAIRMAYDVNGRKPTTVRQAKTDDLGRFRVHTLPPGDYQIEAAPDPVELLGQVQPAGPRPPVPSRTYFPGTSRLEESRLSTVAVGQTVSGVDFTIESVATAMLRGKVVTASGAPANGSAVRVQRVGGPVGEVRGSSSIESNDFMYPSVPTGEFWMMAITKAVPPAEPEYGLMRMPIDGRDVPNLLVATAAQPLVAGRVEGIATPSGLQVVAHETAFEWPGPAGEPPRADRWTANVGADGAFRFGALPGPRLIRMRDLPKGVALKNVWLGHADVTDTGFEIKTGDVTPALRVVLTSDTGMLSGTVKDAAGAMAAGARVVVFSADPKWWGARSRMVAATETKADGSYEISGMLPGDYRVVALSFLEQFAWTDPAVLHQLAEGANAVVIGVGQSTVSLVVKR